MNLPHTLPFQAGKSDAAFFDAIPPRAAVFALQLLDTAGASRVSRYFGRTVDLRRRLKRLLGEKPAHSRSFNLRDSTGHVSYACVGSSFEAQWLLYVLNREDYPATYRQRLRLKPPAWLKLNFQNRFPRLYPTRRLARDGATSRTERGGALYYGPFPSRLAAERWAADFLDFFKVRRCVEDLNPDPAHPGCIYSQMQMCLAPCFGGCSDEEYQREVARLAGSLDGDGRALERELQAERAQASEALEFEQAGRLHRKLQKVQEVFRAKPDLARERRHWDAVVTLPGSEPRTVVFFRVRAGELRGPVTLALEESASPVSLDEQIHALLDPLAEPAPPEDELPPWEHLSLLARWYYSSFRRGELVMLDSGAPAGTLPTRALIRACRRVLGA
jgi:excinuclease ABC subunit C